MLFSEQPCTCYSTDTAGHRMLWTTLQIVACIFNQHEAIPISNLSLAIPISNLSLSNVPSGQAEGQGPWACCYTCS